MNTDSLVRFNKSINKVEFITKPEESKWNAYGTMIYYADWLETLLPDEHNAGVRCEVTLYPTEPFSEMVGYPMFNVKVAIRVGEKLMLGDAFIENIDISEFYLYP